MSDQLKIPNRNKRGVNEDTEGVLDKYLDVDADDLHRPDGGDPSVYAITSGGEWVSGRHDEEVDWLKDESFNGSSDDFEDAFLLED